MRAFEPVVNVLTGDSTKAGLLLDAVEKLPELSPELCEMLLTVLLDAARSLNDTGLMQRTMATAKERIRSAVGSNESGGRVASSTNSLSLALARACVACELFEEVCDFYEQDLAAEGIKLDAQLG